MNTENEDNENDHVPTDKRPLGYWLRAVDGLLTREFAQALEAEGISRRDWMLLNVLSGDVDAPGLSERLARKGKRLRNLDDRGWVEEAGDGTWTLTEAGRAEKERIGGIVEGIRARLVDAVGAEAFATTMSSLEAMARELGWDEAEDFGRGFGPGPGFGRGFPGFPGGPGFGRPFTPEIRFGWGPNRHRGFAPGRPGHPAERGDEPFSGHVPGDGCHGHGPHGHGHGFPHHGHGFPHHGPGHGHGERDAQGAYERGFDAGFARGRESGAA